MDRLYQFYELYEIWGIFAAAIGIGCFMFLTSINSSASKNIFATLGAGLVFLAGAYFAAYISDIREWKMKFMTVTLSLSLFFCAMLRAAYLSFKRGRD